MKAMILAAGFGTRLRPLSERRPKPLMPVANRPVILRNMEYLERHGVREIIVNAHYHAAQLIDFLGSRTIPGVRVEVRVEPEILGTGGGIKNTADFWSKEPFIVLNGDILTDIDITAAVEQHLKKRPLATLLLHDQPPYNKIRLDESGSVSEIPEVYGREGFAFTGIHIMEPELLPHIPGPGFSGIIDTYRELIRAGGKIGSSVCRGHYWRDIGNLADYVRANRELAPEPFTIDSGCEVHHSARWVDWAVVGENCRLENGVEISRSILWEGVSVRAGVKVADSVITSNRVLDKDCKGAVL